MRTKKREFDVRRVGKPGEAVMTRTRKHGRSMVLLAGMLALGVGTLPAENT